MVKYLGPIPVTVPESDGPMQAVETSSESQYRERLWQRVTYVAATLMTASLAFIALAAGDNIVTLVQEAYFLGLRTLGVVTGLTSI